MANEFSADIQLKYIEKSKLEKTIDYCKLPLLILAIFYFFSMVIFPCINGRGNWQYVQDVWDRWQSLNVGVLAFASSVIAFNISRFNANRQRERDFFASKSFLPSTLSELIVYFKSSAKVFKTAWNNESGCQLELDSPKMPDDYRQVFSECIRHADPEVGAYLSLIIVKLQVHDARLRDFVTQFNDNNYINPDKYNLITYLYRLGELQALVGNLFAFARNIEEFNSKHLTWDDFKNAYANLDIWLEEFNFNDRINLEAFTKRTITKHNITN